MNVSVFTDFMAAQDRDIERRRRECDRYTPFREFLAEVEKADESRKAGHGTTEYFKQPTWNFLKDDSR